MDSIHALRDQFGADVAVLIVNNKESCGRADAIGADAETAFVAVHWGCATGYYSFGHEIGHLAGARHDAVTDATDNPFAYGHGFRKSKPTGGWRTIMGYACKDGSCPNRLQFWSSPSLTFDGVPIGSETIEDNTRVWTERAATLAAFRPSVDLVPERLGQR